MKRTGRWGISFYVVPLLATCLVLATSCKYKRTPARSNDVSQGETYKVISETVVRVPANRARTRLGVGEQVWLHLEPVPAPDAEWALFGNGRLIPAGARAFFVAPDRRARAEVTAIVGGVRLPPVTYDVVEPEREEAIKTAVVAFRPGLVGAGMCIKVSVLPNDVSFANVLVKEVSGSASNFEGYFSRWKQQVPEHEAKDWTLLSLGNTTNDRAEVSLTLPEGWSSGSFEYVIPVRWKVMDLGGGENRSPGEGNLPSVVQRISLDAGGTVTVTKLGQQVTRSPQETSGTVAQEEECPETTGESAAPSQ